MSLLSRIIDNPTDLATRAVYADERIDAGDPRGTFIAQQLALAKLDPIDERYAPMLASTRRLEHAHFDTWIGPLDKTEASRVPIDAHANAVFTNGFLSRIAISVDDLAKRWPKLIKREPISGVELIVGEGLSDDQKSMPLAKVFRTLKVSPDGWFTSQSVAEILGWGMPLLRDLDLTGCDLGVTGAKLLAGLPLTRLAVKNCGLGDEGVRALLGMTTLSDLDLGQCRIENAATLTALKAFEVTRFSLSGNNTLGGQLGALADWKALPRLTSLGLPQTTTPAELRELFPTPSTALRELHLASAKGLLAEPLTCAQQLTALDIGTTSLGDEGWAALLVAPFAPTLLHLHANGCSLSDAAVAALVASPLRRLCTLDLSSNKLTDASLALLATWPGIEHVTHLYLGNNRKLTAAGFAPLIEAKAFAPTVLDLGKLKPSPAMRERFGI